MIAGMGAAISAYGFFARGIPESLFL